MKRSKFTEEQILFALKQADAGQPVGDFVPAVDVAHVNRPVPKDRKSSLL